jgi:hypothetical protein
MSRFTYVEHAPREVLHPVVFDSAPRITSQQRVDVYEGDTLVRAFIHNAWHDHNGRLIRYTTDEVAA